MYSSRATLPSPICGDVAADVPTAKKGDFRGEIGFRLLRGGFFVTIKIRCVGKPYFNLTDP